VAGEPAHGAESSDHGQLEPTTSATQSEAAEGFPTSPNRDLVDLLSKLNNSKVVLEGQIDTMKQMVGQRDGTINSLKLINQKLRDELNRLRKTNPGMSGSLPINGEFQVLRDELLKLKNTFTLKVKEGDELRLYNKKLLSMLDNSDSSAKRTSGYLLPSNVANAKESRNVADPDDTLDKLLPDLPLVAPLHSSGKEFTVSLKTGSLDFDAVVTAANGKIKEAFYTEFFIAKSDLQETLENAGINLDNPKYKNIENHAALWAQSRKYPFRYPDLQKDIRKTLLDSIDDEKSPGRRIRTDIDGNSGAITGLAAGSYYIIGTASLGQVGVTWSVPVKVKSGRNKVSLTIANASWSL
jgi:regulator of replication initiation timing